LTESPTLPSRKASAGFALVALFILVVNVFALSELIHDVLDGPRSGRVLIRVNMLLFFMPGAALTIVAVLVASLHLALAHAPVSEALRRPLKALALAGPVVGVLSLIVAFFLVPSHLRTLRYTRCASFDQSRLYRMERNWVSDPAYCHPDLRDILPGHTPRSLMEELNGGAVSPAAPPRLTAPR
jgi:hypothetical protein